MKLKDSLISGKEIHEKLNRELTDTTNEFENLHNKNDELSEPSEELEIQLQAALNKKARLEKQNSEMAKRVQDLSVMTEAQETILQYKNEVENVTAEKNKLSQRVKELEDALLNSSKSNRIPKTENDDDSSMNFLNSIIAEQQKKIEKFESFLDSIGQRLPSLTAAPSVSARVGQPPTQSAPKSYVAPANREYCDICEEFTHDTKLCPNRPISPLPTFIPITKIRAFCDECDMFYEDKCQLHSKC
uniref:Uncharacterized protein n=1 Tax=Panagrolaimus superbus TaxID=310955 RepID=A0A914YWK6_9BILA